MKKTLLVICALLVIVGLLVIATYYVIWQPAPDRTFTPHDLLIDASVMPKGWSKTAKDMSPMYRGTKDAVSRAFVLPQSECQSCVIWEEVHRFKSFLKAKLAYQEMIGLPGSKPSGWGYQSTNADESVVSCYTDVGGNNTICYWVARYREVVIEVRAILYPDRMSLDDLKQLVGSIDEQVTLNLALDK